ncbi:sensor histidine kinase [Sediminicola luteus]|uniref:histidine kinase n=1 Tax=Sediminicola luteus TaxID=319238 RepID=A0A2A4G4A0_9FLAO|nr:HAMP domain-containing sensor histidine kinase [Sediminicola luteus]PCE62796.1 hypothetical protein B7P33_16060 [Sediminicola luteus]
MQKHNLRIFGLLLLSFGLFAGAITLFNSGYLFLSLLLGLTLLFVFYLIYEAIDAVFLRTSQALMALAKNDLSVKISGKHLPQEISKPLQEILKQQMAWRKENESVKIIYEDIIDTMDMGILILRQAEEPIFYSNKAFFNILELPRYTKWHLVKDHLKAFDPYFSMDNWGHIKDVITLKINGKETVFSLRTYVTYIYGERYLIVNLDTLQNIIDRKEKEAWFNLMKVMSHEILNTIAPINSLTHNLTYLVADKKEVLGEDYDDIYQSVNTIKKRTHHLIDFVETYRILAELPTPKPEKVSILELFSDSLGILDTLLETKNIAVTVSVTPKGLQLPLDKKQMEQVIINLITNSVYALEGVQNAGIHLTGHVLNDMAILEVTDNGHGIPEDIKREIFVPFFTTRENGSGIGLSLSKNIVQGHKGTLSFSSKPGRTVFTIQFKLLGS